MEKIDSVKVAQTYHNFSQMPVWFTSNVLGNKLWSKQQEIIKSVRDNKVTTVRSCHGIGKSFIAARTALWYLQTHPNSIVITTAPTFRQVEQILWREMRTAFNSSKFKLDGKMLKTSLEFSEEWFAMGISTDEPDRFQGFHAHSGDILVVVDEAAGVKEDVFIGVDSILSSEGAKLLMIANPTSLTGSFYNSHHKDTGAHKIHVSCFDTPNFTNNGIRNLNDLMTMNMEDVEIVAPYLIAPSWVKDKVVKWGVESPMFQARCLGNFGTAESNTLIPLNLIEDASTPERKARLEARQKDPTKVHHFIAVDPARYGDDKTVITERFGDICEKQIVNGKEDLGQSAGRVKQLSAASSIFIDADGLGSGLVDMLSSDGFTNLVEIHGAAKPYGDDSSIQFVNLRAQIYYNLAQRFKTGDIYIPPDQELQSQLSSIHFKITRAGYQIEAKDEIKKRLKVSPDRADSLAYLFADFMHAQASSIATIAEIDEELYNEDYNDFENYKP